MSGSVLTEYSLQEIAEAHAEPGALSAALFYAGGTALLLSGLCEFVFR